jgi:hypothetical protein
MQRQFDRTLDIGVECDDSAANAIIFNVVFLQVASLFISSSHLAARSDESPLQCSHEGVALGLELPSKYLGRDYG